MDLQELYNKGYRRFKFSDGVVREPCSVKPEDHSQKLRFDVNDARIWYRNDGRPNICEDAYPKAVGIAGESMNKRDEIRKAIENGVSDAVVCMDDEDEAELVNCVMRSLTELVERWTDEETAEDLDKSIGKSEVYEGMRVRCLSDEYPMHYGATGVIVHPDKDGIPGVMWDDPAYNNFIRPHDRGDCCKHVNICDLERE